MKKTALCLAAIALLLLGYAPVRAEGDLPLSDRIKILKVIPYGDETKSAFVVTPKDDSYEAFLSAILERIRTGYKPDCNCDLDNDYFISLESHPDFPRLIHHATEPLHCYVVLSGDRRYAGLVLSINLMHATAHHFVMANSRGEVVWERPPVQVKELRSGKQVFRFPDDGGEVFSTHWYVANDGKLLSLRAAGWFDKAGGMHSFRHGLALKKGWTLYGSDGRILAEQPFWCREAAFAHDGSYFLIQEMLESNATDYYDVEAGTSCYDDAGKLLWRRRDIHPIKGPQYLVSPSSDYILACWKYDGCYDQCVLNRSGEIVGRAALPWNERCSTNDSSPFWSADEKRLYWRGGVQTFEFTRSKVLEVVTTFPKMIKGLRPDYGRLTLAKVLPLSGNLAVGVGDRGRFGRPNEPRVFERFISILDDHQTVGIRFVKGGADQDYRVLLDRRAGKVYVNTHDLLIVAEIQGGRE